MRFAAVLGTIDEIDILPTTITHLRRIGVDRIYVLDAGSTDGTLEYLDEATAQGDISVLRRSPDEESGEAMLLRAELGQRSGADWVLYLDSDEIWLPAAGSLHSLPDLAHADVISVMRYNVVLTPDGPALPPDLGPEAYPQMLLWAQPIRDPYARLQRDPDLAWIATAQEPKVLARPEAIASVLPGDHYIETVEGQQWRHALAKDVLIAHAPFRSFDRFERRARNARALVARHPDFFSGGQGWQFQAWAKAVDEGTLESEYEKQQVDAVRLAQLRREGFVRSTAEIFERLVPEFPSEEAYVAAASAAQPWISLVGRVCEREGIAPSGKLAHLSPGDYPTIHVRPDHVVRLYSHWRDGERVMDGEIAALGLLDRDPELPVARLLGSGRLDDEWRYVVLSLVPGRELSEYLPTISEEGLREVAGWLGQFVDRLHRIPLDEAERTRAREESREAMSRRYDGISTLAVERGLLPRHLADDLSAWLPPLDDLLGSMSDIVVTHGDLSGRHVRGKPAVRAQRFFPTGVVDVAKSAPRQPLWELGPTWWSVLRHSPGATAAFLEAAGIHGKDGPQSPRHAFTWVLLNPGSGRPGPLQISDDDTLDLISERYFGAEAVDG